LERADTLRGTQGALFGRNAVGGAINVISQQPKFEREGQVFLQYGSKHYKQADLIYNLPLSENFAVRFSASGVDQSEGFFYNPSRDEYYDAQESDGQRIQFRYARDRFDGTLLLEHYRATLQSVTFQVVIPNGTSAAFPAATYKTATHIHTMAPGPQSSVSTPPS
jgi:iron complex outermembrane receptor protein